MEVYKCITSYDKFVVCDKTTRKTIISDRQKEIINGEKKVPFQLFIWTKESKEQGYNKAGMMIKSFTSNLCEISVRQIK